MANLILNEKRLNEKVNNFYSEEKNIEQDNPGYYSVIPANVRYDVELCPNAKLLYGEITALCNKKGYCWATNRYFARLYQVNTNTVSVWINQLVKKGYIFSTIKYKEATKEIEKRILSLSLFRNEEEKNVNTPMDKNVYTPITKKKDTPITKKKDTPITKNREDNNTSINNTSINKKESKKEETPQLSFEKLNFKNEKLNNEENIFEQKKVSKKETELSFDALIEKYTQNENLRFELKEHLKTRKLKKAALSNHALELSFRKLDALSNNDSEKIEIVQESIMNSWIGFFPLKPYEKIQKRPSPVSQNTSYNIDEYESSMDVFASNDESNPVDEFNPMDEIRKKQKQVDPSFEKFKAEIKDDAIKRFGPRLGNKILKIKEREEFWETVDTLKDMIKRGQYVWFNGDLVCAADIEEKEEKENFDLFGISDSPQIEPVFDF